MCGILYFYKKTFAEPDWETAKKFNVALKSMEHRGPDGQGVLSENNSYFGHNRLSILDLSDMAAQPMCDELTGNVIVYNGEIYNYRELFQKYFPGRIVPQSDTIVLLMLLNEFGGRIVEELNGMFSFVYYVRGENRLLYCRDRLGIKPLYMAEEEGGLVLSSEIKGIYPLIQKEILFDSTVFHEWAMYGNVLGQDTVYRNIKKIEPGVIYERCLASGTVDVQRYWCPAEYPIRKYEGKTKESSELIEVIRRAVSRQLVSDVPVGVFLSGGVDSSAIAKIASEESVVKLHTYTATFDYTNSNEEAITAKRLASDIGTIHHEVHVGTENLENLVKEVVKNHDGPFSDAASIPLALLCGVVDDEVKVILQGDGGDELFGGYNRYTIMSYYKLLTVLCKYSPIRRICSYTKSQKRITHAFSQEKYLDTVGWLLTEDTVNRETWRYFCDSHSRFPDSLGAFSKYYSARTNQLQDSGGNLSIVDLQNILPDIFLEKVDRSTMSKSKEIRVPLLDNEVLDYALSLRAAEKWPFGRKKYLLRAALEKTLPNYVLGRKKHGFGVPYGMWLKHDLQTMFLDNLSHFCNNNAGVLDQAKVENRYSDYMKSASGSGFDLWKIFMFVLWKNTHTETVLIS